MFLSTPNYEIRNKLYEYCLNKEWNVSHNGWPWEKYKLFIPGWNSSNFYYEINPHHHSTTYTSCT